MATLVIPSLDPQITYTDNHENSRIQGTNSICNKMTLQQTQILGRLSLFTFLQATPSSNAGNEEILKCQTSAFILVKCSVSVVYSTMSSVTLTTQCRMVRHW